MLRRPVTSYVTSVSTVVAPTVVTCYAKAMFAATTGCRRKRSLFGSISVEDVFDENPTQHEA